MQTLRYKTSTFKDANLRAAEYDLAVEELLEIHIDGVAYAITMRLPGDDINLVAGFCLTEGIIGSWDDVLSIGHCHEVPGDRRVSVRLKAGNGNKRAVHEERNTFLSKSSCGVCGKSKAEEIHSSIRPVESFHCIRLEDILQLKQLFETGQAVFPLTGSTHAAAIFDRKKDLMALSEDIGRHNAFDKAIGAVIRMKSSKEPFLAIVSSRLSFEMVQKAGVLGLEIISGLSGPTSMAVRMAEDLNITLIGFLREDSMTIYTHPERISASSPDSTRCAVPDPSRVLYAD
ncbi:MAG: formate dehydrogenase accessory sulfurtransferase FdhD [Syntrophobacteraceae bacterium]|jgi:FdhD protein